MFAAVSSATLLGVRGHGVTVEVHVSNALPGFTIVGLPDEVCRESRDRVRAAVMSSGLRWPSKKVTVNLAPTGHRKAGGGLDLAIAIGVLVADGEVPASAIAELGFIGELGLDGSLRAVAGAAPLVAALGPRRAVVAVGAAIEAAAVADQAPLSASNLAEVVAALTDRSPWPDHPMPSVIDTAPPPPDLADVRGQALARRALEIAAAGGHHVLLIGPPGAGKTMLAQRLPGLLPPLTAEQSLAATMIHSAAGLGLPSAGLITAAPYRSPHHTSSIVALVGGGPPSLRPGEISMAHAGVLFLDELGEFAPTALDGLRQPLEEGVVRVARARASATLPAQFLLIAATNPCPCGGGGPGACSCDEAARAKYLRRLSGPLLDRFDVRVAVPRPNIDDLLAAEPGESSAVVGARVARARALARSRQGGLNAAMAAAELDEWAPLDVHAQRMLRLELEQDRLTGRGYHRVRRVARTIADLAPNPDPLVRSEHVAVALAMRIRPDLAPRGRVA